MGKGKSFINDFKEFALKGNIIDMAVGVVIGGAFGKIVTGLVNYIINPVIGLLTGGISLDGLKTVITEAVPEVLNEAGEVVTAAQEEVAILWGTWLQTIIDFIIVALCIFIVLRIIIKSKEKLEARKKKEEAAPAAEEPAGPTSEELLVEIRDLLKDKK